jgi:molybdate transport system regulatory protein
MSRTTRSAGRVTRKPRKSLAGDGHQAAVSLTLRVDLGSVGAIGPGKIRLLELIGETGSISAAGRTMGMSYRQAWLLIDSLNAAFREPALATLSGGAKGGGAELTAFGKTLIRIYRDIEAAAAKTVADELASLATFLGTSAAAPVESPAPSRGAKRGSRKTRS